MPYLIVDLEMTGPDPEFHDFIQIGAVLVNDKWEKINEFNTLVYPDNEDAFSVYAEKVHGLSIHDLYDAPASYEALEDLEQWVMDNLHTHNRRFLRKVTIAGQSVFNDISFLKAKYLRHKIPWPYAYKMLDLTNVTFIFYKIFDANDIARPKYYNLDAVAEFFGLSRSENTHDALEDARLTYECFKKFLELTKQTQIIKE